MPYILNTIKFFKKWGMQEQILKKEWSTDTCYNTDETWQHANMHEWKMSDTKGHIFYESIYVKCPEWRQK